MKKTIIFLLFVSFTYMHAQVGINTENPAPEALLHIDPKGNSIGTAASMADDVVFEMKGRISIGSPGASIKVEVKTDGTATDVVPGFQLKDGSQGRTRLLVQDAAGFATWEQTAFTTAIQGVFTLPDKTLASSQTGWSDTQATVTLPKGKWWVRVSLLLEQFATSSNAAKQEKAWISATLGDGGTIPSNDLVGANKKASALSWKYAWEVLTGSFIVHNQTAGNKTYKVYMGEVDNFGGAIVTYKIGLSGSKENSIVAFKIGD